MILSTEVLPGEGWYAIAKRLGGSQASQAHKDANAGYLAAANGRRNITDPIYTNQVVWYNPDRLILAQAPPPAPEPPDEPAPEPPADDGYVEGWGRPTWRDEFTTLDESTWTVQDETYFGPNWSWVTADNVSIRNNQLVCQTTLRSSPRNTSDGKARWWNSGALRSEGKFAAGPYGRWEARVKTGTVYPTSTGYWPAVWMRNSPGQGEIDLVECWGSPVKRTSPAYPNQGTHFTVHESTNGSGASTGYGVYEGHLNLPQPYTTAQDFHAFAMEWTPDEMVCLLDGRVARRLTRTGSGSFPWIWGPNFVNNPFHWRIGDGMGDPYWSQNPNPTDDPNIVAPLEFVVDYVRYWELP